MYTYYQKQTYRSGSCFLTSDYTTCSLINLGVFFTSVLFFAEVNKLSSVFFHANLYKLL